MNYTKRTLLLTTLISVASLKAGVTWTNTGTDLLTQTAEFDGAATFSGVLVDGETVFLNFTAEAVNTSGGVVAINDTLKAGGTANLFYHLGNDTQAPDLTNIAKLRFTFDLVDASGNPFLLSSGSRRLKFAYRDVGADLGREPAWSTTGASWDLTAMQAGTPLDLQSMVTLPGAEFGVWPSKSTPSVDGVVSSNGGIVPDGYADDDGEFGYGTSSAYQADGSLRLNYDGASGSLENFGGVWGDRDRTSSFGVSSWVAEINPGTAGWASIADDEQVRFLFTIDGAVSGEVIPEPSSFLLTFMAGGLLLRRRR